MGQINKGIHQWSWLLLLLFLGLGLIHQVLGLAALVCMLLPIIVAFFKGRLWCGMFCPRGSFSDQLIARWSLRKRAPSIIRSAWFKMIFLVVLMGIFAIQIVLAWGNPAAVGQVFVRMVLLTTLVAIILGIIYQPRTWCLICPMGTMAGYVAGLKSVSSRIKQITFNRGKCSDCKLCSKICPVQIDVHSHKTAGRLEDGNCLKCRTCVLRCPKDSLYVA